MARERRPENKGLPLRWRQHHGAYYYQVPRELRHLWDGRSMFFLGKTLPEAYRVWAERIGEPLKVRAIADLLDRYQSEVIPRKAPATQTSNLKEIRRVRATFGAMPLLAILPKHIYQYMDKRTAKGAARREIALLSHALTKAVEWGYIDGHPFKGEVRLKAAKPRERYVENWEVGEALSLPEVWTGDATRVIQAFIRLRLLAPARRKDILSIQESSLKEDGVHMKTSKTGKRLIYAWTPELRAAVDEARAVRPINSPWLFCTRTGAPYIDQTTGAASGWDSNWRRFMKRLLKETRITEWFTEHDLRAKASSDAESDERARALLAHATVQTTRRVYRRRPEMVKPAESPEYGKVATLSIVQTEKNSPKYE